MREEDSDTDAVDGRKGKRLRAGAETAGNGMHARISSQGCGISFQVRAPLKALGKGHARRRAHVIAADGDGKS